MPKYSQKQLVTSAKAPKKPKAPLAKVTIADRAIQGVNAIRKRFTQQDQIDKELKETGKLPTLKLSIGQPDMPPSPIVESAKKEKTPHGYSPAKGWPQYIPYVTALFNTRNPGLDATDDNVLFTMGGTGAIAALAATLLQPGRTVLFPVPGFAAQMPALGGYGGQVIKVPTDDTDYKINPKRLDEMLRKHPETAFVVFNDITNPTGYKYTETELKALGDVFRKHPNVLIFLDETYHDLVLDPKAKFFLEVNPDLKNRTVIQYSMSKDLAGDPSLRCGMVYAPTVTDQAGNHVNLAEKMAGQQLNMYTAVPTIIQHTAARIIEAKLDKHVDPQSRKWNKGGQGHKEHREWEEKIKLHYRENLKQARQAFQSVGMPTLVEPGGGFFLLIDASKFIGRKIPDVITGYNGLKMTNLHERVGGSILDTDVKVANYLAYVANMVMVEASPFGMPAEKGVLRVSVATDKANIGQIADRIRFAEKSLSTSLTGKRLRSDSAVVAPTYWRDTAKRVRGTVTARG